MNILPMFCPIGKSKSAFYWYIIFETDSAEIDLISHFPALQSSVVARNTWLHMHIFLRSNVAGAYRCCVRIDIVYIG